MLITLLTDFGHEDPFAGVMKGVIKSHSPQAEIVDLTHNVHPQDVLEGSILWANAAPYFPAGTIHIGVVDPGVGSQRLPVAVALNGQVFVYPDNGLLTHLLQNESDYEAYEIVTRPAFTSRTFHGRDIFAPAAARLSAGDPIASLGPRISNLTRLTVSIPARTPAGITGHITRFDHYGNAWTNIPETMASFAIASVICRRTDFSAPAASYSNVPPNDPVCVFASHGNLELAIRNGNAMALLGLRRGDEVYVEEIR